ncbi:MAG: hypothetical protein JNK60_15505 [Acidobacteria bacterium]|nr:hypothetical protein [Acidobacteriota bacterium]
MALEPREISILDAPNPELVDMSRRFWVSLTIHRDDERPADVLLGRPLDRLLPAAATPWIQLVLASPVVLWGG